MFPTLLTRNVAEQNKLALIQDLGQWSITRPNFDDFFYSYSTFPQALENTGWIQAEFFEMSLKGWQPMY